MARVVLAAFLWVSALTACGIFSRRSEGETSASQAETSLQVESHHWSDIVVYLINDSQSQRLGTVAGLSTNTFVFPYRQLATGGKVRLRANPVGGGASFTSEDVVLQPGQAIRWTLESDLARSSITLQ